MSKQDTLVLMLCKLYNSPQERQLVAPNWLEYCPGLHGTQLPEPFVAEKDPAWQLLQLVDFVSAKEPLRHVQHTLDPSKGEYVPTEHDLHADFEVAPVPKCNWFSEYNQILHMMRTLITVKIRSSCASHAET